MPALLSGRIAAPATSGPGAGAAARLVGTGDPHQAHAPQGPLVAVEAGVAAHGRPSRQGAHCRSPTAAGSSGPGSGTVSKLSGRCSHEKWSRGHSSTKTLPTTRSVETYSSPSVQSVALAADVPRGVGGVAAVVAHHEDVPLRHRPGVPVAADHRAEAGLVTLGGVVALVERDAVDLDAALLVAAVDRVAGDADDPLDQVPARGVETDLLHQARRPCRSVPPRRRAAASRRGP